MHLDQLITYFSTSPALGLLRSPNAPFVLDFLHKQFKSGSRIAIPTSDLVAALGDYLEVLHHTHPEVLRDRAADYLAAWSSGDTRWLHRYLEAGRNEPVYQLTPHTEDVFVFLDRALQKDLGFVGTESRLRLVINTLADLVAGASHDPEVRLSHLREEQKRIDDEIARIVRDGRVATRYEPAAVRERFLTAVGLLKELLADFRAVEDRFKEITRQVQKRQLDAAQTRGNILQFALDSEDVLKRDDQGVSFYEFVRFILSPAQQERLDGIISELGRIDELSEQSDGLATVGRMVPSLIIDAEQVMRTNQRLSATLRRLLDSRTASDRKRITLLLAEIRGLAAALADDPPDDVSVELDEGTSLSLPFERGLWSAPSKFDAVDLVELQVDEERRLELFQLLAQLHRLNWKVMRDRIRDLTLARNGAATLGELVREFPPEGGMVDLLGYLQIASDDGHIVDSGKVEDIVLAVPESSRKRVVTMPLIVFTHPVEAAHV